MAGGTAEPDGFWLPHTASVDFCEPNYLHTPFIAEVFNAFTSLGTISLFPLLGAFYSNPTGQRRFLLQYVIMISCGLGSFLLHATLRAEFQAADELPMLWLNYAFLFAFLDLPPPLYLGPAIAPAPAPGDKSVKSPPRAPSSSSSSSSSSSFLAAGMALLAALQTAVYCRFQAQYWVFISAYSLLVAVIVLLSLFFAHCAPPGMPGVNYSLRRLLFTMSISSYLLVGFALWAYEMAACDSLLPLYALTRGCSFHILWHLGASMGTYLEIQFLILLTVEGRGQQAGLAWRWGCFPVIRVEDKGGKGE